MAIDTTKFDVMLDASDPDFISDLRKAIGLKEGEQLQIVTPQFERTDGRAVTYFPRTEEEFAFLKELSPANLLKIGCGKWDIDDCGNIHWLYPSGWYDCIPDGMPILCISGEVEHFKKGETDNDMRFGMLAYGFMQEGGRDGGHP